MLVRPHASPAAEWMERWHHVHPSSPVHRCFLDPILASAFTSLETRDYQGRRLLELGCGDGYATRAFAALGFDVVGLDVNQAALGRARANGAPALVRAQATRLPFADGAFDVTVSVSVMQYVDWRHAFAECLRVLRPGGSAFFVENLRGSPLARLYRLVRRTARWRSPPDQDAREHIAWEEASALRLRGAQVRCEAYHLATPLVLWRTALRFARTGVPLDLDSERDFRLLWGADQFLLHRFPRLRSACWLGLVSLRKDLAPEPSPATNRGHHGSEATSGR